MFTSLNPSFPIAAASTAMFFKSGISKIGQLAAHVSGAVANTFQSGVFTTLRSSIDWGHLARIGFYGFIAGALLALIFKIFRIENDPSLTTPPRIIAGGIVSGL